ncbi:MAG: hypothetical protein A3H69_03285 [Candidatus Sungbacteria bacterium RIFCSPLOWO2_02_FULL_47_9]|uniref:Uncharacterized protein n=1 Tax=Candidatus Sungbacteria bacterium RIFCSPHIGHO2_01_FULL_47_32 TaxID=1802264 RepID=A0A1G2K5V5_9BACT|nr:MAG: hypothetical protein A2633_00780 [Candidatus Sungbacteria bacterium RIFCSPHIGHO2_01_FULL_47_32]OHA10409.1 MAG: hypothetical protein A3H69_03285 [Candidatus Sungbacteria bacterium RIFCSPLOWO2_02_FULL_47_9]
MFSSLVPFRNSACSFCVHHFFEVVNVIQANKMPPYRAVFLKITSTLVLRFFPSRLQRISPLDSRNKKEQF